MFSLSVAFNFQSSTD